MKKSKIILFLLSILIFNNNLYCDPVDDRGYPHSYDTGGGNTSNQNGQQNPGADNSASTSDSASSSESREEELKRKIEELNEEINSLIAELNGEALPDNLVEKIQEIETYIQEIAAEKEGAEVLAKEKTEENKKLSEDKENTASSETTGDPVRISQGSYIQEERDLLVGNNLPVEVSRLYSSDGKITGSFGYGWTTNLDERIILGTQAHTKEVEQALLKYLNGLQKTITSLENQIISAYKVSAIESAIDELSQKIQRCRNNLISVTLTLQKLNSLKVSARGYSQYNRVVELVEKTEKHIRAVNSKIATLEEDLVELESDLELLAFYKQMYSDGQAELSAQQSLLAITSSRKKQNQKSMFLGMDAWYEETGLETITWIDSSGFPHLLYEDQASGSWKDQDERLLLECLQTQSGYKLLLTDGTEKQFDKAGLLIQTTDRKGNTVRLNRSSDGHILTAENSFGEKLSFLYKGNFISSITNQRDQSQKVIYSYTSNLLTGICDTEEDTINFEYDSQGRMIGLLKNDGSTVTFEYGEITSDGRLLTTQTKDEEGFAEYFVYDIAARKTVYIDHDQNEWIYYFDQAHRTRKEIKPDGSVILYKYDDVGNLIEESENGNTTCYSYDDKGNKLFIFYSDGSREEFQYDSFKLMTFHKSRDGIVEEYLRDNKGNLTQYRCGGKTVYTQEFDSKGNVTKKTVYGGCPIVSEYSYDSFGNMISEKKGSTSKKCKYDFQNRLLNVRVNDQQISNIEYKNKKIICSDYNGLETTYITNGRKDISEVIQKDTITGTVHQMRIEYDRRHLPVKIFFGNREEEILAAEYQYTKEGKIKSEIFIGQENFIKEYEYTNTQISKVSQYIQGVDNSLVSWQYNLQNKTDNQKLLTITDSLGFSTLFEYDAWGNLKKQTDANGTVQQFLRSNGGRLVKKQNEYGGFYKYEYDDCGNLISSGQENVIAETATWNPDGSIKTLKNQYGQTSFYNYDKQGRLYCKQNEQSTICYEYDCFDRVTKQTIENSQDQSSAVYYVEFEYSKEGRSVKSSQGGKYSTLYELDAFGNVIKQTDGNGNTKKFEYNFQNFLTASYDGYNNKTSYEYNALGLVKTIRLPDGAITKYEYNSLGLVVKISDDCGTAYLAEYDKAGNLIKEKSRGDSEKTYEYDKAGRLTKILCGSQLVQSFAYENQGKKITIKDGNGFDYYYTYDSFGRLTGEQNRLGFTKQYFYDQAGALKTTGGNNYKYDAIGNIIEAQNESGKTQYKYDKGGRLIFQKDFATGEEISFEYDKAGNRTKLISSNRETVYRYGANNEVKEIFDNKQRVSVQLGYNKNGQEVLKKLGNGTTEETRYDKAGRITLKYQKDSRNEFLWGQGYIYSSDGKQSATVDINGKVTLYEYDKQGRLSTVYYPYTSTSKEAGTNLFLSNNQKAELSSRLNEIHPTLANSLTTMQVFIKESYTYDKNGNRITKTTPSGTIEYKYDKENRLISTSSRGQDLVNYTYDNYGNLLSEKSTNKTAEYSYNSENRLVYCEVIDQDAGTYLKTSYAYDAFGRRTLVQDFNQPALRTIYDGLSFDVIKQSPTFANGSFTDSFETGLRINQSSAATGERYRFIEDSAQNDGNRYFYLDDKSYKTRTSRYYGERSQISHKGTIIAQTSQNGKEYFTTDTLGSIRCVTNEYGASIQAYTYDAFGSLIQGSLAETTDLGYTGKQFDPTAQSYNYGYRDYNPLTARFTTSDPIRDGSNWFSYCNGDPVNFVDLWGLCALEKTIILSDQEKITLEAGYMILPIQEGYFTITDAYGKRSPVIINGVSSKDFHEGTDFAAKNGTPVRAVYKGTVTKKGFDKTFGNYMEIKHSESTTTFYAHMSATYSDIGDTVSGGETIGLVGSTGFSTGPHLHYEIRIDGTPINPHF